MIIRNIETIFAILYPIAANASVIELDGNQWSEVFLIMNEKDVIIRAGCLNMGI